MTQPNTTGLERKRPCTHDMSNRHTSLDMKQVASVSPSIDLPYAPCATLTPFSLLFIARPLIRSLSFIRPQNVALSLSRCPIR
jgi:hypothetical protein